MTQSIDFFETQFRKQVAAGDLALNAFEQLALPYLSGRVLDFGCGLGNLALAAARAGCTVRALDAAPTAIAHLRAVAARDKLAIEAETADLRTYVVDPADRDLDAVVVIGLLMFFDCATARHQLAHLQDCLRPGGVAIINVLVEGTTYRAMFDPGAHCLFGRGDLDAAFAGWETLRESFDDFAAPGETVKSFATLVARKPAVTASV